MILQEAKKLIYHGINSPAIQTTKSIGLSLLRSEIQVKDMGMTMFKNAIQIPKNNSSFSNHLTQSIRFYSSFLFTRIPKKVYAHGEEFPKKPEGKQRKLLKSIEPQSSKDQKQEKTSATSLFNMLMGDIINNKSRKNIAVEGVRLIEDACLAGFKPKYIFLQKTLKDLPPKINSLIDDQVEIYKIGQAHMQNWSGLTSPPGILAIFPKPTNNEVKQNLLDQRNKVEGQHGEEEDGGGRNIKTFPLTPVCLNIREPGNLGSILRSAAGVGCKRVLVTKGCVDPWENKVLRGGSGAHFHLEIASDTTLQSILHFIDLSSSEKEINTFEDKSHQSVGIFLADSAITNPDDDNNNTSPPLVPYFDINYTQFTQIFLLLGGETEGLGGSDTLQIIQGIQKSLESLDSSNPTTKTQAPVTVSRVNIPLQNNIESLNVANAFGIISYEIWRQFQLKIRRKV